MAELHKQIIAFLRRFHDSIQAALLDKSAGTAPTEGSIVDLHAGTVKEIANNLAPARLRVGTVLVRLHRGIARHVNRKARRIAHGDTRKHRSYKKIFNDSFHNNP